MGRATLRKIIEKLQTVYIGPIGFEYNSIRNDEVRQWFFNKCENEYYNNNPTLEEKREFWANSMKRLFLRTFCILNF
jgi:2-oxoglutarate dehydrogenase E1 component